MNHVFRSIWNVRTGTCVAVSELTRVGCSAAAGASCCSSPVRWAMKALAASVMLALASPGWCGPAGAVVAAGSAVIGGTATNMTITQASQNAVLNWQSFNVGAGESVRFLQPNSSAVALNRVLGADPSSILGSLTANGRVFLVNPNGILFGKGASVNVGGLVASTANITDADFMARQYRFNGAGNGTGNASVLNQGTISADGGYVALLGATVSNQGTITAKRGSVALAAGKAMTLDMAGDGLLRVTVSTGAVDALASNGGIITADGGQVLLTAKAAGALLQGVVSNTGVIQARTLANQSGRILLLGDMQTGAVNVAGTLDASAPTGGNGGFIETSAAHVRVADTAKITTAAATGKTGNWLIDPTDYTVAASGGDLSGLTLSTALDASNVTIVSSSGARSGEGNVNINDIVSWGADTSLTLTASNHINLNASITATGAGAGIVLNPNTGNGNDAASGAGRVNVSPGVAINLPNVSPASTTALVIGNVPYTVLNNLGADGSVTGLDLQGMAGNLAGHYALGSNIDAGATNAWGAGFMPVGAYGAPFEGTLDGLGHTIGNLTINRPTTDLVGLFGMIGNGAVRNLGLVGGAITGQQYVGAVAGWNQSGTLQNVFSSAAVTGALATGGLVGFNISGTITESGTSGDVTSANGFSFGLGGITGVNAGNISHSYSSGAISGVYNQGVGGLSGNNYGVISDSHSTSNVIGGNNVGGLVGENGAYIVRSYATGTVNAQQVAGGLVGLLQNNATIYRSYATGQVTGTYHVGGLAGNLLTNANVIDSYATGAVSGNGNLGGLAGYIESGVTIGSSYSTGAVTGSGSLGGLVGANNGGAVTNSYWDMTRSGLATSSGGTGLTGSEMQQQASFSGFDFTSGSPTWSISENVTTPFLQALVTPLIITANDFTRTYDGTAYSGNAGVRFSITPDSSLVGTAQYAGTSQGAINAGNYSITPSGFSSAPGQQGYAITYVGGTLTVAPRSLTVTGSTAAPKVYDGTTVATITGGMLAGVLGGDVVMLTQAGSFASKNAGSSMTIIAADSLGGASASNYALTQPTGLAADITRRGLNISVAGIDKVYDGTTNASVSYTDNRIAGDVLSAVATAAAYADRNVGAAKVVNVSGISLNGTDAANYLLGTTTARTTAAITRRPLVVSAIGAGKIYDGTTIATVSYADNRIAGDVLSAVGTGAAFVDRSAGVGKIVNAVGITLGGTDAANYLLGNTTASTTATITRRPLVVSAVGIDKVYDGSTAAAVGYADNRIAGDVLIAIDTGAAFVDRNAGMGKVVNVSGISLSDTDAANYLLGNTTASTTATITPRLMIVNATGIDKVYDGNTSAAVTLAYQYFAVDSVSVAVPDASFADKGVGSAKPVNIGAIVLTGPDAGNYTAAPVAATVASITAAPVTVVPMVPVVPVMSAAPVVPVVAVVPETPVAPVMSAALAVPAGLVVSAAPTVPTVPVTPPIPPSALPIIPIMLPGVPATQAVQAAVADAQLTAVTGPARLAMRDDPHTAAARQLPGAAASLANQTALPGIAGVNLTVRAGGLRMPQDLQPGQQQDESR